MNAKKKILSIGLAVSLAAVAVVGSSLAYFTDKDGEDNTFAVGNVRIDLIEQQRNSDGTALEDFEQGKELLPIVGSAQGEKDQFGQPVAANYVDKMVTVKNTGKNDAYVRAYFAIPSALDDGAESFNASLNLLHFNFGNKLEGGQLVSTYGAEWDWMDKDGDWNYFETEIDGIAYNVYYADYTEVLAAGATTEQFVSGVYLDKNVDFDDEGNMTYKGEVLADQPNLTNGVSCPVYTVAVQAAGFDSADAAMDEAFGAGFDPWAAQ
jgi:predicted ribosomally synthesized peptide with SipW-like signal peptide